MKQSALNKEMYSPDSYPKPGMLEQRRTDWLSVLGVILLLFGPNFGQLIQEHFERHIETNMEAFILCRVLPAIVGIVIIVYQIAKSDASSKRLSLLMKVWICFYIYSLINNYYLHNNIYDYKTSYYFLTVLIVIFFSLDIGWARGYFKIIIIFSLIHASATIFFLFFPDLYMKIIFPRVDHNSPTVNYLGYTSGLMEHYSFNGMFLAIGLIASFSQWASHFGSRSTSKRRITLDVIEICVICFALLLSGKRASFVISLIACALIFFITRRSIAKRTIIGFFAVLGVFSVGVTLIVVMNPETMLTVTRLFDDSAYEEIGGRRYFWLYAMSLWKEHPLFGVGLGGTRYYMAAEHPEYTISNPHNTYLQILAELGLPGIFLFIPLLVFTLLGIIRLVRLCVKSRHCAYDITLLGYSFGIVLYVALYGLTSQPLLDPEVSVNFFMCVSIVGAYLTKEKEGCFSLE